MAATPYIPTILIDAVIGALAVFIAPFIGDDPSNPQLIIRAQQNRVPPPVPAFVELREILEQDLETPAMENVTEYQQLIITTPTRIDIQMDFYGPSAGDWLKAVKAVFRTPYAVAQFPPAIAPLFCSDGRQVPLVTGEEQYENRWVATATLQYNPDVTVPQQSATSLAMNIIEDIQ